MDTFDNDSMGSIESGQVAAPIPHSPTGGDSSRKLVLGGLIVIAVIAIAAVAFATMNAGRSNDGADSPIEAMEKFFAGLSAEDLVASVDAFLPGEADPVITYTASIGSELKRLGVLSKDIDPQAVSGFNFEFSDMTYRTEEIAKGFVRVYITGGDAMFDIDPAELPIGKLVLDNLPPEARAQLDTDPPPESDSMAGEDFYLVAVEEDGGWYLSYWYTIMDAIFTETGYGTPAFGAGMEPTGATSPQKAVEAAFSELLSLDLEGLIGMLPPSEMRALYDYMPLVMDDYNETVGAFGSFVTIDLVSLGTSVSEADSGASRVAIESFDITFSAALFELDGAISYDGECFDITINDRGGNLSDFGAIPDSINSCDPAIADALGGLGGADLGGIETPNFLSDLGAAEIGILTVEEGDWWYLSPTETIGDGILQGLKLWDATTLQQYIDWIVELGSGSGALF
ncbi:MAG: hypothetical protein OER12_10595 [Acidimicrobiia bacterium]|nr:hypothetical protein [Acidimicrobiia bacterium]